MEGMSRPSPLSSRYQRPRVRSMLEGESSVTRSPQRHPRFSAPSTQTRTLREEDICPICDAELPSRGPHGEESAREAHVTACISLRQRFGTRRATDSGSTDSRLASFPSHSSPAPVTGIRAPSSPLSSAIRMLPFIASEKDCIAQDGDEGDSTSQECSICFGEYEVGAQLARLECLCKFHKSCIEEWFMRKQECPVHKVA